ADVAQLVERNLAKVEVAGSRPVVRSRWGPGQPGPPALGAQFHPPGRRDRWGGAATVPRGRATWPSGEAEACTASYRGSIPLVASSRASAGANAGARARRAGDRPGQRRVPAQVKAPARE